MTLSVVIVLLLVGSSATALVLILSWQADTGAALNLSGERARWLADACAERALAQARFTPEYGGSESLTFDDGTCTVAGLVTLSSTAHEIHALGLSGDMVGRTLVSFELSVDASGSPDGLTVSSRSHVVDF